MGASRLFSGSFFVISEKSETDAKRLPGDVGLYLLIAMIIHLLDSAQRALEELYTMPRRQAHDRLLTSGGVAGSPALALRLGRYSNGVDRSHLHSEYFLDRLADLGLLRLGVYLEGIFVVVEECVTLLGDHRPQDDITRILHLPPLPVTAVMMHG